VVRTCGMHGGGERCLQCLVGRPERDQWEDIGIGGRITLSWTLGR
jgi:hypothetical protein